MMGGGESLTELSDSGHKPIVWRWWASHVCLLQSKLPRMLVVGMSPVMQNFTALCAPSIVGRWGLDARGQLSYNSIVTQNGIAKGVL